MSRTAIYARYSSHNQDGGTSIDVQLDYCRRAAGGAKCREYIDRAESGTSMDRTEFNRMLADAEKKLIDTLYVYKWDRFGRSAHAHVVVADLEDLGVTVVSVTEGREPLSRGIQLVVAEDVSRKMSERITAAKIQRFNEGVWHGGRVAYGYKVEDGRLKIDEGGRADLVRRIFHLYGETPISLLGLSKVLNSEGIPTAYSDNWGTSTIRRMLMSGVYIGRVIYGHYPNERQRQKKRKRPDGDQRERFDPSLAIISDELFAKVQMKIGNNVTFRPMGAGCTRLFSTAIRCAECGHYLIRRYPARSAHKARWACGRRLKHHTSLCPNTKWTSEKWLTEWVLTKFAAAMTDTQEIIAEATAEARTLADAGRAEVSRVQAEVARLDRELERITERLIDPDLQEAATKRLLSRQVAERSEQRDALHARYKQLATDAQDNSEKLAAAVEKAFREVQTLLEPSNPAAFNQAVKALGPFVMSSDGKLTCGVPAKVPHAPVSEAIGALGIIRAAFWARAHAA